MDKLIMLLLLACICFLSVDAQNQAALRHEYHAGVYGLSLNPSMVVHSTRKWDLQIAGGGLHVLIDYAYIKNTHTLDLLSAGSNSKFTTDPEGASNRTDPTYLLQFNNKEEAHFAQIEAYLDGPALAYKINPYWTVGAFYRWRIMSSVQMIPASVTYDKYNQRPYFESFMLDQFRLGGIHWREVGIHGSHLRETGNGFFSFGLNIKFLTALDAVYLRTAEDIRAAKWRGDSLYVQNALPRVGFTNDQTLGEPYQLNKNGSGISFDLGWSWTINGPSDPYQWRLGVALLDIGQIGASENAQEHRFEVRSGYFVTDDLLDNERFSDMVDALSRASYGQEGQSLRSRQLKVWMPAGISIQVDKQLFEDTYAHLVWVQRLPMPGGAVDRANSLHMGVRYELSWFGVSASLQTINYKRIYPGIHGRLGFITIGSDNLTSLFGKNDFWGTDFFIGLRYQPELFGKKKRKYKNPKRSRVKCYKF